MHRGSGSEQGVGGREGCAFTLKREGGARGVTQGGRSGRLLQRLGVHVLCMTANVCPRTAAAFMQQWRLGGAGSIPRTSASSSTRGRDLYSFISASTASTPPALTKRITAPLEPSLSYMPSCPFCTLPTPQRHRSGKGFGGGSGGVGGDCTGGGAGCGSAGQDAGGGGGQDAGGRGTGRRGRGDRTPGEGDRTPGGAGVRAHARAHRTVNVGMAEAASGTSSQARLASTCTQ